MADHTIEQFLCRTPKRKRPNHIAMPGIHTALCTEPTSYTKEKVERQDSTVPPSVPRPPVPPRRHTLAEICRYADEQCAYIEWLTRELEAEEAARRHSTPTTPAGAITNPFSGPADMWWRPISANEMYGKSALRRQQEEEEERGRMQHPYLAANGLPDFHETNEFKENDSRVDLKFEPTNKKTESIPSDPQALDDHTVCAARGTVFTSGTDYDLRMSFENQYEYDAWLRRGRWSANNQLSHGWQNLESPCLKQDSIILMIPKALLCFLLLPLILTVSWCNCSFDEDEE